MKKKVIVLKAVCFLMAVVLLQGCATIFAPSTQEVTINSNPKLDVYLNGVRTGTTPIRVKLKPDKTYTVEFKKDGTHQATTFLNTRIELSYVLLDILFGMFPLVVDAITGAWNEFENGYIFYGVLGQVPDTQNQNNLTNQQQHQNNPNYPNNPQK